MDLGLNPPCVLQPTPRSSQETGSSRRPLQAGEEGDKEKDGLEYPSCVICADVLEERSFFLTSPQFSARHSTCLAACMWIYGALAMDAMR